MSEFDFILDGNSGRNIHQTPTGTTMAQRIMVVGIMLVTIIIALVIVFGVLLRPDQGPIDTFEDIYTLQSDLISLSDFEGAELRTPDVRSLSVGTTLVLKTDRGPVNQVLVNAGREITEADLLQQTDSELRTRLAQAKTNNTYDETYNQLYRQKLAQYRVLLQEAYADAASDSQRAALEQSFNNVSIILGVEDAPAES